MTLHRRELAARRALPAAALALAIWAAAGYATAGFRGTLAAYRFGSSTPWLPIVLASLLVSAYIRVWGWRRLDADVEWLTTGLSRATVPIVCGACAFALLFGVSQGTFAATGSDGYGYVSQAELWRHGRLRVEQPFVKEMPWPNAALTFTPLAYRPGVTGEAIVPTVAPGLPILMALFTRLGGSCGAFYVVPIFGAIGVWFCYLLGTRAESAPAGAVAAIVFATSPVFLAHVIFPWTDVPAAACWTAALVFALGSTRASSLASGLWTALAIAIRPNLVPLAAIPLVFLVWTRRPWWPFLAGTAPGISLVAAVNAHLYGSPFRSGYGDLRGLYAWRFFLVNVDRYSVWIVRSQTPLIALSLVALTRAFTSLRWMLTAFVAAVFGSYLFYMPFEKWWFLRFLLPALPVLIILMVGCAFWLLAYVPRPARVLVVACGTVLLVARQMQFAAADGAIFDWKRHEHRYVVAGRYVAAVTPPNAVIISMQHSGSVRFYSGRLTLRYDWLAPEWLDRAIAWLRQRGYRPFILLEDWEEGPFKDRFAAASVAGRLATPPIAWSLETIPVSLYEPVGDSRAGAIPRREVQPAPMPWVKDRWCRGGN